jgi:hypothetical protein
MVSMNEGTVADLDALRNGLSAPHRGFVNALWTFYRDHNQWVPPRIVHQHFGKTAAQAHLAELGPGLVRTDREAGRVYYRLTFLGVLLTDPGAEGEDLLVRYLEYVRDRYRSDPRVEWVSSHEVEAALRLQAGQSRLLRQLLRLSHWWGGGSAFGGREWTVGVPVDVDDLVGEADLRHYVREHVLRHFPIEARPPAGAAAQDDAAGGAFWFVEDPALREHLAADWHEAQDVCHVRGWKSCVVLCGGILEALLWDALTRAGAATWRGRPRLARLAAAAIARRLLQQDALRLSPALQAFRTLVGSARASRAVAAPGRTEAESALESVRACLREFGATPSKPTRQAGR